MQETDRRFFIAIAGDMAAGMFWSEAERATAREEAKLHMTSSLSLSSASLAAMSPADVAYTLREARRGAEQAVAAYRRRKAGIHVAAIAW